MKRAKLFIVAACFVILGITVHAQKAGRLQFNTVVELQQFLSWSPARVPLISAHRGGPEKGFPENAIETFENSIRYQPLVIECDITLTKDSVMVLMHDDRLDRTTTGKGPIGDYTYEQLRTLQLKDNEGTITAFKIPTLDEALNWGKGKVIYTLDVKRSVPYAKVIEAIRRCKAEAFSVVITYNASQAAEVSTGAPDLMISASIGNAEALERLNKLGVPDNRLVAFVGTREADPTLYQLLHAHKITCILGTMGNLDKQAMARGDKMYAEYIDRGADLLSSDRPRESGAILLQYAKDHGLDSEHIVSKKKKKKAPKKSRKTISPQ